MSQPFSPVSIHNGEVLGEFPGVQTERPSASAEPRPPGTAELPTELQPNEIARAMAAAVSEELALKPQPTPMELVNRLLQLKNEAGEKLVFTRFDLFQIFAIWSKRLRTGGPT